MRFSLTQRSHTSDRKTAAHRNNMNLFETGSVAGVGSLYPFKDDSIDGTADTTSDSETALNLAGEKAG